MSGSKAQLILDLGVLESIVSELDQARDSMRGLSNTSADIAGQVGHSDLAGRVSEFSSGWEAHRRDIENNIQTLAEEIAKIAEGMRQTDAALASALTEPSAS